MYNTIITFIISLNGEHLFPSLEDLLSVLTSCEMWALLELSFMAR